MSRPRAGIDLDGVIYPWSDVARALLAEHRGEGISPSKSWDWIKDRATPESWKWLWSDAIDKHGLFSIGDPYPGSAAGLSEVERLYSIVFITHRPARVEPETAAWISRHLGLKMPWELHVLSNSENKAVAVAPCEWYVDDKPQNCMDFAFAGRRSYVWDRPWNQDFEMPGAVRRAARFSDIIGIERSMRDRIADL